LTRALVRGVAVGALSVVAGLSFLAMPLGIGVEEWAGLGLLFKLRGPRTPPSDVVVVAIDRPAAEALGLPLNAARWPRSYHADLIDALHQGGAAVIVFDVVFDEPGTPFDDRRLAESMQRAGTVLLAQQLLRESVTAAGRDPRTSSEPFHVERLASPLPSLAQAAAGVAPFPLPKVPVQVSRYWTFKAGAGNAPSLPVVAFKV
jgi:adenylate cyclase